mgnify:CR=1 FL=1
MIGEMPFILIPTLLGLILLIPFLMWQYYEEFKNPYTSISEWRLAVVLYLIFGFLTIPITIIIGIPYLLAKLSKKE